jgi:hypothetical protein
LDKKNSRAYFNRKKVTNGTWFLAEPQIEACKIEEKDKQYLSQLGSKHF